MLLWHIAHVLLALLAAIFVMQLPMIFTEITSLRSWKNLRGLICDIKFYTTRALCIVVEFVRRTVQGKLIAVLVAVYICSGALQFTIPITVWMVAAVGIVVLVVLALRQVIEEIIACREKSWDLEYIDLGPEVAQYTITEYEQNLSDMADMSDLLGMDYATISAGFDNVKGALPNSILDVGCGSGWLAVRLANHYTSKIRDRQQPHHTIKIIGIDTSKHAIQFAKRRLGVWQQQQNKCIEPIVNVSFESREQPELNEAPKSVDVVTCSLMCHHIPTEDALVQFFKSAGRVARRAVVVNDLERHPMAALAFRWLFCTMFPNRLSQHDGLLSIHRSFVYSDWVRILTKAGFAAADYKISWRPFHRWIVYIDTTAYPTK